MKGLRRYISISLILSLLLHLYVFSYGRKTVEYFVGGEEEAPKKPLLRDFEKPNPPSMPTRILSDREYREIVDSVAAKKLKASQVKDKARFLGTQTQRVEKETRAAEFGSPNAETKKSPKKPKAKTLVDDLASLWKLPIEGEVEELSEENKGISQKRGSMDILSSDVAIGADTILNTDEYIYASFFNRLKQEIGPRWEPKVQLFFRTTLVLSDGVYSTRYAFYLDDDGYLLDIEPLEASGSGTLDSIAAQAIRDVGRFPNPPQALKENGRYKVIFGFVAEYTKSRFLPKYVPDPRFQK